MATVIPFMRPVKSGNSSPTSVDPHELLYAHPEKFLDFINERTSEKNEPRGSDVFLLYLEASGEIATAQKIEALRARLNAIVNLKEKMARLGKLKSTYKTYPDKLKSIQEDLVSLQLQASDVTDVLIAGMQQELDDMVAERTEIEKSMRSMQKSYENALYVDEKGEPQVTLNHRINTELYEATDKYVGRDRMLSFAQKLRLASIDKDKKLRTAAITFERFARYMFYDTNLVNQNGLELVVDPPYTD